MTQYLLSLVTMDTQVAPVELAPHDYNLPNFEDGTLIVVIRVSIVEIDQLNLAYLVHPDMTVQTLWNYDD